MSIIEQRSLQRPNRSDAADEVRLLFGHFFVSREQSQYCDYALETKTKWPKSILNSSAASDPMTLKSRVHSF